jgi:hypothetical protein
MEAKELRIGNWVLLNYLDNGADASFFEIEEITSFTKKQIKKGIITPIPLTEEWLLKFGFSKKFKSSYWHPEKCWHRYTFGYTKFGLPSLKLEPVGCLAPHATCNYVHQIQNLYFALTGKELEFAHNLHI